MDSNGDAPLSWQNGLMSYFKHDEINAKWMLICIHYFVNFFPFDNHSSPFIKSKNLSSSRVFSEFNIVISKLFKNREMSISSEHHLDPMSAKCFIYSHERWIHVESLLIKYKSMSLTQNHIVKS